MNEEINKYIHTTDTSATSQLAIGQTHYFRECISKTALFRECGGGSGGSEVEIFSLSDSQVTQHQKT